MESGPAVKRVLVVDDETEIVTLLTIRLGLAGYAVRGVYDGAEAIEQIREDAPDIVLLDVVMPGVSGLDVLAAVREFSRVPIIVFAASEEVADLVLEMGADDCISKPFDMPLMLGKMKALIAP